MRVKESVDATGLTFFYLHEADTVEAMTARIVPGDAEDPGAREAGVLAYIDRALSGAYAAEYGGAYREGIRTLNDHTGQRYRGKKFFELSEADQDAVVGALERGEVPGFGRGGGEGSTAFFEMVWAHTMEGLLSDPAYGGNRDAAGWRLVGFPGPQYGFSAEELRYGTNHSSKSINTLADIQGLARGRPDLFFHRPDLDFPAPEESTPVVRTPTRKPGDAMHSP
jgi:gluconate 2-dehydrogenase gamma chain